MKRINDFISHNIIIVIFVIAVLIGLANYVLYPYLVRSEYEMIEVPIAKEEIKQNTKITNDLFEYVSVPLKAIPAEVENNIEGKYVLSDSKIIKGGFFYKDLIGEKENLTENKINNLNEGEFAISIPVDAINSTNDLISKNQYIDVFFDGEIENKKVNVKVFGMIAENVRVVETFNANSIETDEENKSYVVLAVDDETYGYIKRAELIGNISLAIKYDSYNDSHFKDEYYSIEDMRYLIDANCKVYKRTVS